jgi:MFS family permease
MPTASSTAPQSPPARLWTSDFAILLGGLIITLFGSGLLRFALSLYVLDITGRADIFATILAISYLPTLLSPLGGVMADRVSRRYMICGIDYFNTAIMVIFILFLAQGEPSIYLIGTVMTLLGLTVAFAQPAVQASVPSIVASGRLEQANGLIGALGPLSNTLAPLIGASLYIIMPLNSMIIVSAVAFLVAAILETFLRIPFTKRASKGGVFRTIGHDLAEGFAFIRQKTIIFKFIVLAALINLFVSPFYTVGVPYILRQSLQVGDFQYGLGMALMEIGMILGALTIGLFTRWLQARWVYLWFLTMVIAFVPPLFALSPLLLTSGTPAYVLFFIGVVPLCLVVGLINIYFLTLLQKITPPELLGKVFATLMAISTCAFPIGQFLYGQVFQAFDPSATMWPTLIVAAISFIMVFIIRFVLPRTSDAELLREHAYVPPAQQSTTEANTTPSM